ncbi:conserved hypothetical protein [Sporisorium reilianum SRZ2]|uniref:cutinase n=1 Tax=Sporisorium reilianum (strain SRZ2) TaxID=999809 RepID=E6ZVU7_SPORE|nr:conserved hypothetical protein [Sporisorium reilianum SRZ2]
MRSVRLTTAMTTLWVLALVSFVLIAQTGAAPPSDSHAPKSPTGPNDGSTIKATIKGLEGISQARLTSILAGLNMNKSAALSEARKAGSKRLPKKHDKRSPAPLMMGMGGMGGMGGGGIPGLGGMGGMSGLGSMFGGGGGGGSAGGDAGGGGGGSAASSPSTGSSGCPPLYLIFARGTGELQGTFGIVGRPLCNGLQQQVSGTQCYDVVYTSDAEYMMSPGQGAQTASAYMASITSRCPSTKFVLGGYSKGAMVVHSIKGQNIVGAVTFGDPLKMQAVPSTRNWKCFCAMGDPVCENGFNVMAHVTYGMQDVGQGVQFLSQAYRSSCGGGGGAAEAGAGAGAGSTAAGGAGAGADAGGGAGSAAGGLGSLGGMGGLSGLSGLGGMGGLGGGGLGGGLGGGGLLSKLGSGGGLGSMGGLGGLGQGMGGFGLKKRSKHGSASHSHGHHHPHHHHHHQQLAAAP